MTARPGCVLLAAAWLAGAMCHAQTINWYSVTGTNRTSAGAPMTSAFSFELGVFKDGFVPSAANTSQWLAKWVPAQRVAYNESLHRFDDSFTVVDNSAPFSVGTAAYVWGFQGGVASSEWMLFRGNTWTWPVAYDPTGPPSPLPVNWDAATATAVLGAVNASGSPWLLQSAAVTDSASPPTTWPQWQASALAGEPLAGPDDDPDHDGVPNLLEYIFGTPPTRPGAPPVTSTQIVTLVSQQYVQITVPRRSDHPAVLSVQVSSDLSHWDAGPAVTEEISNSPSAWVVRDRTPLDATHPQRFMRLQAGLAAP